MEQGYLVLKYYYYTTIEKPEKFREAHHLYCIKRQLRGRIKIAKEGINGTISGTIQNCEVYMKYLRRDARFASIDFGITTSPAHVHAKLHVRLKEEIVHSGLPPKICPSSNLKERHYIDGPTFQEMRKAPDVEVIDVRSTYEHALGHFEKSVTFDIASYREFFTKAPHHTWDKNKRYIVVCTRGIKSEKARDFLRQSIGLPQVYQLKGGILDYGRDTDGQGFEGSCYVFDNRRTFPVNVKNPTVLGVCCICKSPCERMANCANPECNTHTPMCESCGSAEEGACSKVCREHPKKRPYDSRGYYLKKTNGYNPYLGVRREA